MSVFLAKTAGFCFGVSRAVELVEQAVASGQTVATLGPIIHNRHAVNRFAEMGVRVIETPEEAKAGETVVVRSHGVSKEVYSRLEQSGAQIIDATCPFVKRIHTIVQNAEAEGRLPVIIGTPTHPEVQGIAGWCNTCQVFETPEELENWARELPDGKNLPICLVSQTTSTESLWKICCEIAKKEFANLKIYDTRDPCIPRIRNPRREE